MKFSSQYVYNIRSNSQYIEGVSNPKQSDGLVTDILVRYRNNVHEKPCLLPRSRSGHVVISVMFIATRLRILHTSLLFIASDSSKGEEQGHRKEAKDPFFML